MRKVGDAALGEFGNDFAKVADELPEQIGFVFDLRSVTLRQPEFQSGDVFRLRPSKPISADLPPSVNGLKRFPLGIGKIGEITEFREQLGFSGEEIFVVGQKFAARFFVRHRTGFVPDDVDDGVAVLNIGVEFLENIDVRLIKILLSFHLAIGGGQVAAQTSAQGAELVGDTGNKDPPAHDTDYARSIGGLVSRGKRAGFRWTRAGLTEPPGVNRIAGDEGIFLPFVERTHLLPIPEYVWI